MFQRRSSSLLELEAADYFKLDLTEVHMFNRPLISDQKQSHKIKQRTNNQTSKSNQKGASSGYEYNHKQSRGHLEMTSHQNNDLRAKKADSSKQIYPNYSKQTTSKKKPAQKSSGLAQESSRYEPSVFAVSPYLSSSSTTSTNSLPSISSSPSVSPSLVCPHLSLDDILARKNDSKSPHTIGLCPKCRLEPPPNIHSPLSPAFKPSLSQAPQFCSSPKNLAPKPPLMIKRGYSDHRANDHMQVKSKAMGRLQRLEQRDDSLDYCLEPGDLRRLQMSPTLRHSVEFIRNNTTEAGRVVKIYKNGQPYDRPLRICVMHGEFATLNHLLDHINSRQLIPSGARYLFHCDGQLVYSVNELKHGSTYIVSGTRNFDTRANNILKEEQKRQQNLNRKRKESLVVRIQTSSVDISMQNQTTAQSVKTKTPLTRSKSSLENLNRSTKNHMVNDKSRAKNDCAAKVVSTSSRFQKGSDEKEKLIEETAHQEAKLFADEDSGRIESLTKSAENLVSEQLEEKPISLVRAKSELASAPNRPKKNVTFVDTGRGSSPAIDSKLESKEDILDLEASHENQADEEKEIQETKSNVNKLLSTNEIGIQVSDSIEGFLIDLPLPMPPKGEEKKTFLRRGQGSRFNAQRSSVKKASTIVERNKNVKTKRQVVTITERQLSLEEMDQFKDLDHGDHHSEATKNAQQIIIKLDSVDEVEGANCVDNKVDEDSIIVDSKLSKEDKMQSEDDWQYPGGRKSSATPTERPISQSEANETVHARVTTPTPSLSTVGDNNSLSYDTSASPFQREDSIKSGSKVELPTKERVPILGKLCKGINPPAKNFKLMWIHGFNINDSYPENSSLYGITNTSSTSSDKALLSPTNMLKEPINQFVPRDRFHNWICHSKLHDELIYPVGSLIILWCRWTNEQRYYGGHKSSVSAITLAGSNADLAASSQLPDTVDNNPAIVHLWSLTSLETLMVIDDDQFLSRRIFSLKIKNSHEESCEMSVAARDDKQLWLYVLNIKLKKDKTDSNQTKSSQMITVIKANKLLQANQEPLLITFIPRAIDQEKVAINKSVNTKQPPIEDLVLSFGRRHFQVWTTDMRQHKLRLLQAESKSSKFIASIVRANCIVRLSPNEFLVGDDGGEINLLVVNVKVTSEPKTLFGSELKSPKYILETNPMLKSNPESQTEKLPAITCLSRVSGNIFASADSTCTVRFWKIERLRSTNQIESSNFDKNNGIESSPTCQQVSCISLPCDLGFICSIVISKYNRKQAVAEFYVISTGNAILFGSVQLQWDKTEANSQSNSTLSVVYEGHETSISNLIADRSIAKGSSKKKVSIEETEQNAYFTCSLDCKICKWNGKSLVWKSMLPSACASLAVHPIGFVLAVGSADGTVYILDKISGLLISYFPLTPVCINCLTYSRDGMLLAAGCANGSIFILPVYESGLKYKKVSIFQSPHPVVSLQFSIDNRYILTSVIHGSYQELILWDLPKFRYMRDNVTLAADKIEWFDPICSGSEDVRAIWDNANIANIKNELVPPRLTIKRLSIANTSSLADSTTVVNLSCHRLLNQGSSSNSYAIASDMRGYLRLFRYPCYDNEQAFFEIRISSSAVNCCRFLTSNSAEEANMFVSSTLDGSVCLWKLE